MSNAVTFNKKTTRAAALVSSDPDKIFFPTDGNHIVMGGKEWGGAEDPRVGDLTQVVPLGSTRHQDVAGFLNELNFKVGSFASSVFNVPLTFYNTRGFVFTAPARVTGTIWQTVNVFYTVTRSDGNQILINDLLDNLAVASNDWERITVAKTTDGRICVTIADVRRGDRFFVYDQRDPSLSTGAYEGLVVMGGPTSAPSIVTEVSSSEDSAYLKVVAYIYDFSPNDIAVSWKVNGAAVSAGISTSEAKLQDNGKYSAASVLTVTPTQYSTASSIKVQVTHQGKTIEVSAK